MANTSLIISAILDIVFKICVVVLIFMLFHKNKKLKNRISILEYSNLQQVNNQQL